ncbi:S-methyl-5'-thioadenosine phosphorylase-like [Gigantopelta aegis]|uniref:S-methyl-5'-thioadenosine phosphorylase-like n=1 Tax=Gigantopelta aegis TaxID=1735272 RepID=UPI001B88BFDF|nr:S-methyl-5'-thioadenosine phosphorylase-like [Gigantopelta aegis]
MTSVVKIGLITGTGLADPDILHNQTEKYVKTPFGEPSDALILGTIHGVDCVLLSRHGRKHSVMPSKVNYRANLLALKEEGCTHIIVTTACGSLQEDIRPGDLVVIDQFIDRTQGRNQTFYDGTSDKFKGICHIPMDKPFCQQTRKILQDTMRDMGFSCHAGGTVVTINGPRFSSKAESKMFKNFGADVVNMSTVPEVVLAKELGLCYASLAIVTDFDSWKEGVQAVNIDVALNMFKLNVEKVMKILVAVIPKLAAEEWTESLKDHQDVARNAVMYSS